MKLIHSYKLLLGILLCFITLSPYAQKELEDQLIGLKKMNLIISKIDSYFEQKRIIGKGVLSKQDEKDLKHWKRWEYYMSSRLDEKGEIVNVSKRLLNVSLSIANKITEQTDLAYGSWSFIGPSTTSQGIGRVNQVAFHPTDPNTVFIGTAHGGLWKSTNGGLNWICISSFISNLGVSGIVIDHGNPNILYILTGEGDANIGGFTEGYGYLSWSNGVLKSVDGGSTWNKTGEFPNLADQFYTGYKLIQDPINSNILFAATSKGLFKTINAGGTWEEVWDKGVFDVAFKPGNPTIVYAASNSLISPFIYSNSSGNINSWASSSLNMGYTDYGRSAIGISAADPSIVYLLTSSRTFDNYFGLFKATGNNPSSFSLIHSAPDLLISDPTKPGNGQAIYDITIAVSPSNANTLLVGGINSWLSSNGGLNFSSVTTHGSNTLPFPLNNYVHSDCHRIEFNPLNNHIYNVNDGGVWKSTNGGTSWDDLNDGLQITQYYHATGTDAFPNMILGGTQDNGTKLRGPSGTSAFTHIIGADGFDALINYNDPTIGFVVANKEIYKVTGLSVTNNLDSVQGKSSYFPNLAMNTSNPNIIYAGYYNNCLNCSYFYKSVDNGTNWTTLSGAPADWAFGTTLSNANRLYTAGRVLQTGYNGDPVSDGRLYRTDDAGANWNNLTFNSGMPPQTVINNCKITDIGVSETNSSLVWVTYGGFNDSTKVLRSTDAGNSWTNISGSLPNIPINCIAIDNANGAYIGTDIGVFYKGATSSDWTPFYNGLPQVPVTDLIINTTSGTIKAVTYGRGAWQSLLHSPCTTSLNLSGNISGNQFFEASNDISTTNITIGGEGTKIGMKAGGYVLLNVGFTAAAQQEFKAYIGGCGNGGVPFNILTDSSSQMEISSIVSPANGMKFPYGNITTIENLGQTISVSIRTAREGNQQLVFTDSKGVIIRKQNDLNISIGERTLEMEIGKNTPGTYYLFLYQDNMLIHFQEVIVK